MPNYAKAIPPEKLDTAGLRQLYDKVAEFLPVYLNYSKMAPAVTQGEFSQLSPLDALDVVPFGKAATLASKLAPVGAMVINPKTVGKFLDTVKRTKESINLHIDAKNVVPEFIDTVKEVAAVVKTRYPNLYKKLSGGIRIEDPSANPGIASYLPFDNVISISNIEADRGQLLNAMLHELRHLAQRVYNNPAKALFKEADYDNLHYFDPADLLKYYSIPGEIDANHFARPAAMFLNYILSKADEVGSLTKSHLKKVKKQINQIEQINFPKEVFRAEVINNLSKKFMNSIPNFSFRRFNSPTFTKLPPYLNEVNPTTFTKARAQKEADKLFNSLLQLQE